jgi:hypothetical protein
VQGLAAAAVHPAVELDLDSGLVALAAHGIEAPNLANPHGQAVSLGDRDVDGLARRQAGLGSRPGCRRPLAFKAFDEGHAVREELEDPARLLAHGAQLDAAEPRILGDRAAQASPKFVAPEARIAVFDQDGTTWVEQPMYTQVMYCLERVPVLAKAKPELKDVEPFKTVLSGNREAMAKLTMPDLEKILAATLTGMTVE